MPYRRTRLVAPATTLLLVAVSLGGDWSAVFRRFYLDW